MDDSVDTIQRFRGNEDTDADDAIAEVSCSINNIIKVCFFLKYHIFINCGC